MPQRQIHDPTNKLQIRDLNEMFRELYAGLKKVGLLYLPLAGGTMQGPLTLPGAPDVTLASTGNPLQIGTNTLNIAMDNNEIQARANGSAAVLELNNLGGAVRINGQEAYHKGNVRKSIWSGSWSSGNISVPSLTDYWFYEIRFSGTDARAIVDRGTNYITGGLPLSPNASPEVVSFSCTYSGTTLTLNHAIRMTHIPSGNHGAASNLTVSAIYGIL